MPDTSGDPAPNVNMLPLLSGDTPTPDQLNAVTIAAPADGSVEEVTVTVDPELQAVLEQVGGDIPVSGGSWVLNPGDSALTFDWQGISNADLQASGLLNDFAIYGGAVTITEVTTQTADDPLSTDNPDCPSPPSPPPPPVTTIDQYDMYRYLNPVYASQGFFTNLFGLGAVAADQLPFNDAVAAGQNGASTQDQILDLNIASDVPDTLSVSSGLEFSVSGNLVTFDPLATGQATDQLQVAPGVDIGLVGTGVAEQVVDLNRQGLIDLLNAYNDTTSAQYATVSGSTEVPVIDAEIAANGAASVADAILGMVKGYFDTSIVDIGSDTAPNATTVEYQTGALAGSGANVVLGNARTGIDSAQDIAAVVDAAAAGSLPQADIDYELTQAINADQSGTSAKFADIYVTSYLNMWTATSSPGYNSPVQGEPQTLAAFEFGMAQTIAHEVGHTLGLVHAFGGTGGAVDPSDVMAYAVNWATFPPNLGFNVSGDALTLALDQTSTPSLVDAALAYYTTYRANLGVASVSLPATTSQSGTTAVPQGDTVGGSLAPLPAKAVLLTSDATGQPVVNSFDFGTATVGTAATHVFDLVNYGTTSVQVQNIALSGSPAYSLVPVGSIQQTLAPGASEKFTLVFNPVLGPASGTLSISTSASTKPISFAISGKGTVAGAALSIETANDNLGGVLLGKSATASDALVLHNYGSQTLTINAISVIAGADAFHINGLPSNLATSPISIAPGGSYNLSVTFAPTQTGLAHGVVQISSNDHSNATVTAGVDGLGAKTTTVGKWGNNYVEIQFPNLGDAATIRTVSDNLGHFSAFLPPGEAYTISIFDPVSGLIAKHSGITATTGPTDMTSQLVFKASAVQDTNGDGLPDDIKGVLGASMVSSDSNNDGTDDFTALKSGLNPVAGIQTPMGDNIANPADANTTSFDPIGNTPIFDQTYSIQVHANSSLGTLSAADKARLNYAIDVAKAKLEAIVGNTPSKPVLITGPVDTGLVVSGLRIEFGIGAVDGAGGAVASTQVLQNRGDGMPALARVTLDKTGVASLLSANNLGALISALEHEFLRALGFGGSFAMDGLVDNANPASPGFIGANAVAAYDSLTGTSATSVPLDNRANAKPVAWNEAIFGNEVGTPLLDQSSAGNYINGQSPISAVTVGALQDLGYTVNRKAADPYSLPVVGRFQFDYRATAPTGTHISPSDPVLLAALPQAALTVSNTLTPPTAVYYAFGAPGMTPLKGYTRVNPTTRFTTARGYGFVNTTGIAAAPLSTSNETLTSNDIQTSAATFRVALANGTYNVYLTLGDNKTAENNQYYYLNGVRRGVVSTAAGEHVTIMDRVEVVNGYLTVKLSASGSSVALNALAAVRINSYTPPTNGPNYSAGRYYVALENLSNGTVMRSMVDLQPGGALCPQGVLLAPDTAYREYVYSVDHNTVGYSDFVTAASGTFDMPNVVMGKHLSKQTDGSGLESLAEFIIGLPSNGSGKTAAGITYLQALRDGIDPTAGTVLPTGIVGSQTLNGGAQAVTVVGSTGTASNLTAYVSTSNGLSIVDVTQPTKPTVLSSLPLPGQQGSISVDTTLNEAAIAAGGAGLNIVDVSNSLFPALLTTVQFSDAVTDATARDGIAYVSAGTSIATVDLATFEVRATLDLSQYGATTLQGLAFDGKTLYAIDAAHQIWSVGVNGDVLTKLGSLSVASSSGTLTIGGDVLYVPAFEAFPGGYQTVDISNPASMRLISSAVGTALEGTQMALNGTGLAVAIGAAGRVNAIDTIDVSDPTNTNKLNNRTVLPQTPLDVALANGFAFVADGSAGLMVVNYDGVDVKGVPPSISIASNAVDISPATAGVQVAEGTVLTIHPTASDDVQVRNIQLLVNGKVVANEVAYPFDFNVLVPSIASSGSTLTVQAVAYDTGGNKKLSNVLTLNVVPDTVPPTVVSTSITQNASLFYVKSIQVNFDKRIDTSKLNLSGMSLVGAGADGVFGTQDDITVPVSFSARPLGQTLTILLANALPAGKFEFRLSPSVVFDTHGNQLSAPVVLDFTVRPASDVKASTGVPAISQEPSANPGQTIGIAVPFDPSTAHMVFNVIDTNGNRTTRDIAATQIDVATSKAFFQVPLDAVTGNVTVYGLINNVRTNFTDGTFPLEIVPIVTSISVSSVASDGSSANVQLRGYGFIEGNNSAYTFGSTTVVDTSPSSGPDVYNTSVANDTVNLTVPLNAGTFGPIGVTTTGGTSAPLVLPLTSVVGVAMSGTPANAALPSANPGQAITLTGTGLSTSTAVIMSYTGSDGVVRTVFVNPSTAKADGTSATMIVPAYLNGITTLSVLGSSTSLPLQIVPTLSSYYINGTNSLRLYGTGLQEGSAVNTVTYNFAGATLSDTSAGSGPDVQNYIGGSDNNFVDMSEPVHGFGTVTTTTAGGTSAPLSLNEVETGIGLIRGIALDPSNPTHMWVADNGNPAQIRLIDTTTGQPAAATPQQVSTIPITNVSGATNSIGNTSFFGSIQIVPQAFNLGFTPVPAGSLLVFYGPSNPDYVVALDPTSGAVISSLVLAGNYDTTAGVYDPNTGDIFVVDRNHSGGNRVVAVSPVDGSEDPNFTFAAPFNLGDGGLALDPASTGPNAGTLWLSSDQSGDILQVSNTGTVLRHLTVGLQSAGNIGVSGIVFDASGNLLVSTNQGIVLKLNPNPDFATPIPTLAAISALATDGTPANASLPSADAGQVISLTGSNFNAGTEVVFQVRDASGNVAQQAVAPLSINPAGTSLQVQVPVLATTGAIQVVNVGSRNLGFGVQSDGIYRGLTVQFTAGSSTGAINFADAGLESLANESWGIDNVAVSAGNTVIFSDNFESGTASGAWTQGPVDTSTQGAFTSFLGRFNSGGTTLNLSGLTAGQTYTLKFDLYALDSLDGLGGTQDGSGNIVPAQYGPDTMSVTVDGTRKLNLSMSNYTTEVQNFNGSATLPLQIVPTLSRMDGSPSGEGTFDLFGSGFQAGAMTVTVGGVTLTDSQFANQYQNRIFGYNGEDRIVAPQVLDGPVTVATAGGTSTLPGYSFPAQPSVQFTGIVSTAASGTPANGVFASANTGQTIVLTGQGFTNSTYVLFPAQDASGTNGQVVRTGTASPDGKTLTVVVPELARTGNLQVMGSAQSYRLQIVPVLRSVGGAVQAGNTIELDATGLPPGEVTVQVDGRGVGTFTVKDAYDVNQYGVGAPLQTQQILTLVVPQSIGPGVITVQTTGGIATLHAGVTIATQPAATPKTDAGDTIATALAVALPTDASIAVPGTIGDGANGSKDVDLYQVSLGAGDTLSLQWSGLFYSQIRFFDAGGNQLGTQNGSYVQPNQAGIVAQFVAPSAGLYYVGVSGYPNANYNPNVAASGSPASYVGAYSLTFERMEAGGTRLASISATAASGTAAHAGVAAANIGQTIVLNGTGLLASDQVVFTSVDDNGSLFTQTVSPTAVAQDGTSLTVAVPSYATTGTVRLARENVGLLLQIVPTLTHVDVNINGSFYGGGASLTGSGFAESNTTINFGATRLADTARDTSGLDIYSSNHSLNFTVPNGISTGPLSVTTLGGTSAVYGLSFTGISSTPLSGSASNNAQAAANPGQAIVLAGSGLDTSTDIVFATIDDSGNKGQVVVHPISTATDGTSATVIVPSNATSGVVRVVGDVNGNGIALQIVPTISRMVVNSVASDGS